MIVPPPTVRAVPRALVVLFVLHCRVWLLLRRYQQWVFQYRDVSSPFPLSVGVGCDVLSFVLLHAQRPAPCALRLTPQMSTPDVCPCACHKAGKEHYPCAHPHTLITKKRTDRTPLRYYQVACNLPVTLWLSGMMRCDDA